MQAKERKRNRSQEEKKPNRQASTDGGGGGNNNDKNIPYGYMTHDIVVVLVMVETKDAFHYDTIIHIDENRSTLRISVEFTIHISIL